jgi:hypothetical protein
MEAASRDGVAVQQLAVTLPNTRVKLAAPFYSGGLTFVAMKATRRSLRAFR